MAKKLYWDNKEDLKIVVDALGKDEVVISSTDTIYGFLANMTQAAWQKILDLKQLDIPRPFLILLSSTNLLDKLSYFTDIFQFDEKTLKFITTCWPGPVTFIFPAKKDLPPFLSSEVSSDTPGKRTIALRCPQHAGLQAILSHFNGLFSTSANKAMEPAPVKFDEILQDLLDKINVVIVDSQESHITQSSTLVDLSSPDYTQEFPFKIIREGAYSTQILQDMYRKI